MTDALTKLGEAARRARAAISPWNVFSPTDIAGALPGGGIPSAAAPYGEGLRKTAEATKAFREGRYGDAARWYGSGVLDTGTAALSALPEGASLAKLAAAFVPALKRLPDALPLDGGGTTVYHGTGRTYDQPKLGAPETTLGRHNLEAHYVTARPETANAYSTDTGQWRINTDDWSPQTRIYSMGDADTLALTPDEFWIAKRVGTGQDPATFGKHARGEYDKYVQYLTDAFGEAPAAGEGFTEFLQRKGVQRVTSGGSKPDEIMVTDPSILGPRFRGE